MLRADSRARLRESTVAMERHVWPIIGDHCGGGTLWRIEGDGSDDRAFSPGKLDELAGIDFVQESAAGVPLGLAARVQWVAPPPFETFTLRARVPSGRPTELDKRLAAYREDRHTPIWPEWTVQAYFDHAARARLLSVAVIQTVKVLDVIERGTEGAAWSRRVNETDGAEFVFVRWAALRGAWAPWIWRAP